MTMICDLCNGPVGGRSFTRRNYQMKRFCSINCVEAFEVRSGLPNGRIYEARPGWSVFPLVRQGMARLPC